MIRWLRDYYRTLRTLHRVAERECKHDGSDPMCGSCTQNASGW